MTAEALSDLARMLDPSLLMEDLGFDPDPWQRDYLRATDPRLLVLAFRQAGKSQATAALALHSALFHPGSLTVIVSRSQRQSNELFRKVTSAWKALGRPRGAAEENATTLTLGNDSRIVSLPPNPDTIVGFSDPRLVVLDEGARIAD